MDPCHDVPVSRTMTKVGPTVLGLGLTFVLATSDFINCRPIPRELPLTTKTASGSALRLTASDLHAWEKSISGNTGIPFEVGGGGGTKLSPAEINRAPDEKCGR